ncbi:hypothetical protein ASG01_06345 [Chryseobacterium sp. Leaf180]|uniref:T9SS type A sorting domain-containing protein n=1 Tax=Chryseobacterium sp. Leaf180 TaxID=1736289 RepID=UPI0006FE1DF6|nr:T9SS type A sorting domain-containing protein [Chryseobacterium sp. Leaf180]KQR95459.1 hypothetical protein ASG01_06345 [Chryseobacterium sp. Leaf180]
MIKKLLSTISFIFYIILHSQSTFEYQRSWGTYLGPIGGKIHTYIFNGDALFFDSQNNIYTKGYIEPIAGNPVSYYQQYSLGGGQNFQFGPDSYSTINFYTKFNSAGTLLSYQYHQNLSNIPGSYTKELLHIDQSDNKYFQFKITASTAPPIPITTASWNPSVGEFILAKYDSSDNLLWATYLPSAVRMTSDNNLNVFVTGTTFDGVNIGTPGAYQDNYQYMYNNGNPGCGFLVKLNPNGQRLWGTLYPGYSSTIKYFSGAVYLGVTSFQANNQIIIPTANAFQTIKGQFALLKINANDGSRNWGTYYANPTGSNSVRNIEVNESGLYILGDESYQSNNANPNFYGTVGSHKPQNTSPMDLFLTKFSHAGVRLWSTYVGGSGWDLAQGSHQPIAVSGNDIYICGQIWGVSNNVATSNVYQQSPTLNTNLSINRTFSKFNTDGVLQWTSYYGGSSTSANEGFNIAVKNSSLYLYGDTASPIGITTPGSFQAQFTDPYPTNSPSTKRYMNFLVKFDLKNLNTSETAKTQKITLHDNPNNGNFALRGDIFGKEGQIISIFDLSGRLVYKRNLVKRKEKIHHLNLQPLLEKGNYMVNILGKNGNLIQNFKMTVNK